MFMIMNETLKPGEAQHMHFGRNVPAADRTQAGREFRLIRQIARRIALTCGCNGC
jgi:hypothetical protein